MRVVQASRSQPPPERRLSPRRYSVIPASLRLIPNLYLGQTQPGFESIAWEEIVSTIGESLPNPSTSAKAGTRAAGVRELGRRSVPDRAGMTIFTAPRPEPLRRVRTLEDLFAVTGYRKGLTGDPRALDHIVAHTRAAPFVATAIATRTHLMPGARAGHRLRFRVVARMVGERDFRREDFARAVARAIGERGDHLWRLSPERADVEFWATLLADEFILAIRLSDDAMRHREYKVAHMPGSLRPAVAAALGWLSRPSADDVVLDPFCGAATILIERAQLGRYRMLMGCDYDPEALAAARQNIGPRYKPVELHPWDASAIPLPDRSVDKIITNLPWGMRHGSHPENRRLYPRVLGEFHRLLKPGGRLVLLTGETRLMSDLTARGMFRPDKILHVTILGARAAVYTESLAKS